jgi:hypothetical protein
MMQMIFLKDMMGFIVAIVAMGCFTGMVVTWLKVRSGKQLRTPQMMARLDEIAARLGELDHAIDTIAVEVERISEGQRFVARVLADRTAPAQLPEKLRSPGSTTPH